LVCVANIIGGVEALCSFVGHSLGGLIIRQALTAPSMQKYNNKLYTLVTLSTPHLGTQFFSSSLLPGAMWLWQKCTSSPSLKQVRFQDAPDLSETFVFQLSKTKGLENFRHVILVSAEQDLYVPFHSARIELPRVADGSKHAAMCRSMVHNLLAPVLEISSGTVLVRVNVIFGKATDIVDGAIGRHAHIRLLDNHAFTHMFVHTYKHYFQ